MDRGEPFVKRPQKTADSGGGQTTLDTILNGRIRLRQPRHGYRFSLDAVLLAGFAAESHFERVADLGTGCGIIALLLAHWEKKGSVWGIEIQAELARLAKQNVAENRLSSQIRILHADFKKTVAKDIGGPVDLVVSNPPFCQAGSARINPNAGRAAARHEVHASLPQWVAAAARLLKPKGRLAVIFPAQRLVDLLAAMRSARLEPKRLMPVHSVATAPARAVVVEACRDGRAALRMEKPLVVCRPDGPHTRRVRELLEGRWPV